MDKDKITIVGAAIVDIIAGPVDKSAFDIGSMPMDTIKMAFGGDALNEAVIMSRLGLQTELITRIGMDEAGNKVLDFLKQNGVECVYAESEDIETGINIVLVDKEGQRTFLTNPNSSLRKLSEQDVYNKLEEAGNIVCFASMFVSSLIDIAAMERIFARIKSRPGRILVVDMTTAKNGETLADITGLLPYIDYLIPNEVEAEKLTGICEAKENAKRFVDAGVKCVVIKCGRDGCIIQTKTEAFQIPAYSDSRVVDTTGAGDSFVAGFVWGLKNKLALEECGRFACAVASCNIEKYGAQAGISSLDEPLRRYKKMGRD